MFSACRIRVGRTPLERTPCATTKTALEKSIRGYAEKLGDEVIDPGLGTTFDFLGEAYDFYNLYLWEHGFGIRYGKSRLNAERTTCMQEIVCGCSVILVDHLLCKGLADRCWLKTCHYLNCWGFPARDY
jgi:hypothetical protein